MWTCDTHLSNAHTHEQHTSSSACSRERQLWRRVTTTTGGQQHHISAAALQTNTKSMRTQLVLDRRSVACIRSCLRVLSFEINTSPCIHCGAFAFCVPRELCLASHWQHCSACGTIEYVRWNTLVWATHSLCPLSYVIYVVNVAIVGFVAWCLLISQYYINVVLLTSRFQNRNTHKSTHTLYSSVCRLWCLCSVKLCSRFHVDRGAFIVVQVPGAHCIFSA